MIVSPEREVRQSGNLSHLAGGLLSLLDEESTLDVVGNLDCCLWANRLGRGFVCEERFSTAQSKLLLNGIETVRQIEFDLDHPILETIFPLTGDRIEGLIWPVLSNAVFAIRTRRQKLYSLGELTSSGVLSDRRDPLNARRHRDEFAKQIANANHFEVIRPACSYRRKILLIGPTGSGKTTFANSIIAEWAESTPSDRVAIIEDTLERQYSLPNHVQLLATPNVSQAQLLAANLRLNPEVYRRRRGTGIAPPLCCLNALLLPKNSRLFVVVNSDELYSRNRFVPQHRRSSTGARPGERVAPRVEHMALFVFATSKADGELAGLHELERIGLDNCLAYLPNPLLNSSAAFQCSRRRSQARTNAEGEGNQ